MRLTSDGFEDGGPLPGRFGATGAAEGVSPAIAWSGAPEGTRSLALAAIDRHPVARDFVHWVVVDLPPDTRSLPEGASGRLPAGRELRNTTGRAGWHGPKPPPGSGPHPYEFTVFALSAPSLSVPDAPTARDLEAALDGNVLDSGTITGTYER